MTKPKTPEEWAHWATSQYDTDDASGKGFLYWRAEAIRLYGEQVRSETIEKCARAAEICGCDADGHWCASKIRELEEKK